MIVDNKCLRTYLSSGSAGGGSSVIFRISSSGNVVFLILVSLEVLRFFFTGGDADIFKAFINPLESETPKNFKAFIRKHQ